MDITFNKVGSAYVAEFEVTADFNLHIEQSEARDILVYQRTAGNQYDLVKGLGANNGNVVDIDFTALVYPKFIKVLAYGEPTVAVVTVNE